MCEAGLKTVWMEKIIKLGKCGFKTMLGSHYSGFTSGFMAKKL